MSLVSVVSRLLGSFETHRYNRRRSAFDYDLSFTQAAAVFKDPNALYAYMHQFLRYRCPALIREHRQYFNQYSRGFGEDAFHAMWWLLLSEFKPRRMLEIGVYRGQVISLWSVICRLLNYTAEIHGISPFTSQGDSVSSYLQNLDYQADVLDTFKHWGLPTPVLVKSLSTDPEAIAHIQNFTWDLIYIDGNHDYSVALADYRLCYKTLRPQGILVLDDASVGTSFRPPHFAFSGHPGPSRVARDFADNEMLFLGAVGHNNVYQRI